MTNNAKAFNYMALASMCCKYGLVLVQSSNYYPQGNGEAKSSNKNLVKIIKKIVGEFKRSWDSKIRYALWVDRTTMKASTSFSPFQLVYGAKAKLPIQLNLLVLECLKVFLTSKILYNLGSTKSLRWISLGVRPSTKLVRTKKKLRTL